MAQLAGRCSLRDIVSNLSAQSRKLYHLGVCEVSRSSLARVNAEKPWELFQSLFGVLLAHGRPASPGHGVPVQESVALAGFDGDPHVPVGVSVGEGRGSCRGGLEVLEPAVEDPTPQGQHGVGTGDGPAHAAALEAVGDDRAAGALDDAGTHQAHGAEFRVAHPLAVGLDVSGAAHGGFAVGACALGQRRSPFARPHPAQGRALSERRQFHLPQMLPRTPHVHDLDASRQRLRRRVPDPLRAVAGHHAQLPAANPDAAAVRSRRTNADGSTSVSRAAALLMATERRAGPTAPPSPKTPNTATFAAPRMPRPPPAAAAQPPQQPLHPLRIAVTLNLCTNMSYTRPDWPY